MRQGVGTKSGSQKVRSISELAESAKSAKSVKSAESKNQQNQQKVSGATYISDVVFPFKLFEHSHLSRIHQPIQPATN